MRRGAFILVAAGLLALAGAERSLGNSTGISGRSTSGCGGGGCHGTAASGDTTVVISAPSSIAPGAGADLTVTISSPVPTTGINQGGFNLRPGAGTMSKTVPSDTTIRTFLSGAEVGHTTAGNDQRSWTVRWQPPAIPSLCEFVFNAAGNAVDGDGVQSSLDHWNTATASTLVSTQGDTQSATGTFTVPAPGTAYVFGSPLPAPTTILVGMITIQIVANDDTGIDSVEVFDEDLSGETKIGDASFAGIAPGNAGTRFSLLWNAGGETPGPHTLRAHLTDCAGNVSDVTLDLIVL